MSLKSYIQKIIQESLFLSDKTIPDFANVLKSFEQFVEKIDQTESMGDYVSYEVILKGKWKIKISFGAEGRLYNIIGARGSNNKYATTIGNALQPFMSGYYGEIANPPNARIIFDAFANKVNAKNKKELSENKKLDNKFDIKEFANILKSISKLIDYIEIEKTQGYEYALHMNNRLKIYLSFKEGKLHDATASRAVFNKTASDKAYSILYNFSTNSNSNQEETIFKTFMNVINSKNKNTIKEDTKKPNIVKNFADDLKGVADKIKSISFNYKTYEGKIYRINFLDGGSIDLHFYNDGKFDGTLTNNKSHMTIRFDASLISYVECGNKNLETIFKIFVNVIKFKKNKLNESSKSSEIKNFYNSLKELQPYIKEIKYRGKTQGGHIDDKINAQSIYYVKTNDDNVVALYFSPKGEYKRIFVTISGSGSGEKIRQAMSQYEIVNNVNFETIFKTFMNVVNSKNKTLEEGDIKKFGASLKSLIPNIDNIYKEEEAPNNSYYVVRTNDAGIISVYFTDKGDYSHVHTIKRTEFTQALFNTLQGHFYDSDTNFESVFKMFMNVVNSKKH